MPCGGIEKYSDVPPGKCWVCNLPNADHYCAEWDCMLHAECVIPFLISSEGQLVMEHGHSVHIWFSDHFDYKSWSDKIKDAFERRKEFEAMEDKYRDATGS